MARPRTWTRSTLLTALQTYVARYGRVPTLDDMARTATLPTLGTLQNWYPASNPQAVLVAWFRDANLDPYLLAQDQCRQARAAATARKAV